jgi:hypothetical protein
VNNEFERIRKKTVMTQFEILFRHVPVWTEKDHEKTSEPSVSRHKFEPLTPRIHVRNVNASANVGFATFVIVYHYNYN